MELSDYYNDTDHANLTRHGCHRGKPAFVIYVLTLTIACIGLPLTLVAILAVYSMVRKDHVAPIYVINLLVTDLIQLCCMIVMGQDISNGRICSAFNYIHHFGVTMSIFFMVVISLERYLMIAWPLWYKFRRNITTSAIVCVVVWLAPLTYLLVVFFAADFKETFIACFLLLPFPLLIFFLAGTLRALSAARSVPPDEKRSIVAILVLVLLIYTLLFLPRMVFSLSGTYRNNPIFKISTIIPVYFSPLADLFLYVFTRKGICDRLLASVCCCKMDHDDTSTSVENNVTTQSGCPVQTERKDGKVLLTGGTETMSPRLPLG